MIDLKQDARQIANEFMRVTNNFSFNPKELGEELKNSKDMRLLDYYWIKTISSAEYRNRFVDGRNEVAARKAQELADVKFIKNRIEKLPETHKMKEVCDLIKFEHKTLQQTFTGFVFYHILITSTERQQNNLIVEFGESFYRLPLI